jgi:NADH dehydrogenase [ubiquinone] 1 alpha subcomplex assembly factor 7
VVTLAGNDETLRFGLAPAGPTLALLSPAQRAAPVGATAEAAPAAVALAAEIARRVAAGGGGALVIDYGPAESAPGDSLQAVQRHRPADPLAMPGEADLTAHVDFAALARAAREAGAAVHGPVTQGTFLSRLGIEMRAARLMQRATETQAADIRAALARLLGPAEMGTLFKVLAIAAPSLPVPPGFDSPPPPRS